MLSSGKETMDVDCERPRQRDFFGVFSCEQDGAGIVYNIAESYERKVIRFRYLPHSLRGNR